VIRALTIAVFACVWGFIPIARAQDLGAAPRGTIFGDTRAVSTRDRLDVTTAIAEAFDTEPPPELRSRIQQASPQSGGFSSMLTADAGYERQRRVGKVTAEAFTALQYYPRLGRVVALAHSVGVGSTLRLTRSSTLEFGQTADYSPSYLYRLFPLVAEQAVGEITPAAPDYRVDETRSVANSTRLTVRTGRSRGKQMSASIEHGATEFHGGSERPDLDTLSGRVEYSHGAGRTGTFSIEYEYRAGEFGYEAETTEQRLRMSANYSPSLSRTRRAQFRFSLAPSAIQIPPAALNVAATGTLYRMEGEGAATYPFLRSWLVGGSYRRGLEYIAVLREPVFRDAARLQLTGLVRTRVDLLASGGYVVGESVVERNFAHFDTYTGTVRGRYSVTRSLAVYAEYQYYFYNLRGQFALAPDLPAAFEQQGVRVGLMLWTRPLSR
jgi:hypothetical protein